MKEVADHLAASSPLSAFAAKSGTLDVDVDVDGEYTAIET